jgi:signal transduction histidine kinase
MRARVLALLTVFSLAAVVALVVPLLATTSDARTQTLLLNRIATLDRLAALAREAGDAGDIGTVLAEASRLTELYGEDVLLVGPSGRTVLSSGSIGVDDPGVRAVLDSASRNLAQSSLDPIRPWSARYHLLARPVGTPHELSGAVVLRLDARPAIDDVRRSWALILVGALGAEAALLALAILLTRWVVRPVRRLDDAVLALAETPTAGARLMPAGPPELRHLTRSFGTMADTVARSLEMQRRMVADSSHQLRNPLAALRLRIDALEGELQHSASPRFAGVQRELDRFEALLADLLRLADVESRAGDAAGRSPTADVLCDLDVLVPDELAGWRPLAAQHDVRLADDVTPGLRVAGADTDVRQILAVLVDNAIKYAGAGAQVQVTARRTPAGVRLSVVDDGPGLPRDQLDLALRRFWRGDQHQSTPGTGLGLPIAEQLAVALGGALVIEQVEPHGLAVHLDLQAAS